MVTSHTHDKCEDWNECKHHRAVIQLYIFSLVSIQSHCMTLHVALILVRRDLWWMNFICCITVPRFGYWHPQFPWGPGYFCCCSLLSLPWDSSGHRHSSTQHSRGCVCLHASLLRHWEKVEGIPVGISLWHLWTLWWVLCIRMFAFSVCEYDCVQCTCSQSEKAELHLEGGNIHAHPHPLLEYYIPSQI